MLKTMAKSLTAIVLITVLCILLFGVDNVVDTLQTVIDRILEVLRELFHNHIGWLI